MGRIKKEEYKSAFFCLLLASAVIYAGYFVTIAYIALPFVFIYSVAKGGCFAGGAAVILSLAVAYFLSVFSAAVLASAFLPLAFAGGYAIRSKKRMLHSVIITSSAAVTGIALSIYVISLFSGLSFIDYFTGYFANIMRSQDDSVTQMFYMAFRSVDIMSGAITLEAVKATPTAQAITIMRDMLKDELGVSLVSLIGIYSLIGGYLSYIIPRAIAKNNKMEVAVIPAFSNYELPKMFWLAFALSYLAAAGGVALGLKSFGIVESAVYSIFIFVFIVQALSFLDFLYKRRSMGRGVRVLTHILAVFIFGSLLALVGLVENIFSFRKQMDERQA